VEEPEEDERTSSSAVSSSPGSDGDTSSPSQNATGHPSDPVKSSQSRKRKRADDDLEERYLERLAAEQRREEASRRKRVASSGDHEHTNGSPEAQSQDSDSQLDSDEDPSPNKLEIPQHETLALGKKDAELEKANRTVFLSNVSTAAIASKSSRRALLQHLSSFISELPEHKPPHKVESLRFRSTAFTTTTIPKRAAYAKKELMDATTKSTNAYAVYTTSVAAREAVKQLNGSIILDRHLRVDSVAHPAPVDHRRCVFVGNLGFVDDESLIRAAEGKEEERPYKTRAPGDVEEGLWRQFSKAGVVESVRVIRDPRTRIGKGFAYVQFKVGMLLSMLSKDRLIFRRTKTPWRGHLGFMTRSIHRSYHDLYA
jgi:nucleolar protein 12